MAIRTGIAKAYAIIGAYLGKQWTIVIHKSPTPKAIKALHNNAFLKLNLSQVLDAAGFDKSFSLAASSFGRHTAPAAVVEAPYPFGQLFTHDVF